MKGLVAGDITSAKPQPFLSYYSTYFVQCPYMVRKSCFGYPYVTDFLRYTYVAKIRPKSRKSLNNHSFSSFKMRFVNNLLNHNKTIILLNLAEYRLILNNKNGCLG